MKIEFKVDIKDEGCYSIVPEIAITEIHSGINRTVLYSLPWIASEGLKPNEFYRLSIDSINDILLELKTGNKTKNMDEILQEIIKEQQLKKKFIIDCMQKIYKL